MGSAVIAVKKLHIKAAHSDSSVHNKSESRTEVVLVIDGNNMRSRQSKEGNMAII